MRDEPAEARERQVGGRISRSSPMSASSDISWESVRLAQARHAYGYKERWDWRGQRSYVFNKAISWSKRRSAHRLPDCSALPALNHCGGPTVPIWCRWPCDGPHRPQTWMKKNNMQGSDVDHDTKSILPDLHLRTRPRTSPQSLRGMWRPQPKYRGGQVLEVTRMSPALRQLLV